MGVSPDIDTWMWAQIETKYTPWTTEIPMFRCPSDPGFGLPASGRTNYAACVGDGIHRQDRGAYGDSNCDSIDGIIPWGLKSHSESARYSNYLNASMRGPFVPHVQLGFNDILDGLTNTVIMAEINTDLLGRICQYSACDNQRYQCPLPIPMVMLMMVRGWIPRNVSRQSTQGDLDFGPSNVRIT